jgi:hypothetical protein
MITLLLGAAVGALAGIHIATWGMYKDAPHEGFTWLRYSRGIVLATVIGAAAAVVIGIDLTRAPALVVFFGVVYILERAVEEFYKTFLREEDQSKYTIPMQFHVFGRVVESRTARWAAGAGVLAAAFILFFGARMLAQSPYASSFLVIGAVGTAASWFSAFGGAWKDAPIEGFETLKFFRSPGIALCWVLILMQFTDNLILLGLASAGYTVATIETYKTFFFPSKPRGKFANKPVYFPDMLKRRQRFVPAFVGVWALVVAGVVVAFVAG